MKKYLLLLFIIFGCKGKPIETSILIAFSDSSENYGFKDIDGNIIIPAKYQYAFTDTFKNKIAFVVDSVKGIIAIDSKGNYVLAPLVVDNGPDYVNEGLFRVTENNKIGFADENGNKIISCKYNFVSEFQNGLANFCVDCKGIKDGEITLFKGGKWGYINKKGEEIIPAKYDAPAYFEEGKVKVQMNGLVITIDTLGKVVN